MIKNSIYLLVFPLVFTCGCKKFLEAKPDSSFDTLNSIEECQALLDASAMSTSLSAAGELGADTYYVLNSYFAGMTEYERKVYSWQRTLETPTDGSWDKQYAAIGITNVVLGELPAISSTPASQPAWDNVRGSALFYRGFYYHELTKTYTKPYHEASASDDLGLPLRLSADFKTPSVRATLGATYARIIADLRESAALLPVTPLVKTRPGKPAAYAALSRVYLSMARYDSAGVYADMAIKLAPHLLDFNTLAVTANNPLPTFEANKEVLFVAYSGTFGSLTQANAKINDQLYQSYASADLRKKAYFRTNTGTGAGTFSYKADWRGTNFTGAVFGGFVMDELYLSRAECRARAGDISGAMADLNLLLKTRWDKNVPYVDLNAATVAEAVKLVLQERKKELLYRGTRWMDLRRLSDEPAYYQEPARELNGTVYRLPVSSPAFVHLLYTYLLTISGIQQNP